MNTGCRKLSDQDRADIFALKGQVTAPCVAARFDCAPNTVYAIWQQRYRAGISGRRKRHLTEADRSKIIELKAAGFRNRDIMAETGFGECTVSLVIREARAEGKLCLTQSAVVADTAGAVGSLPGASSAPAALPPRMMVKLNDTVRRMRDSFKARGMPSELALREALRIYAGSAVEARGGSNSRAAGGGCVSPFHEQNMQEGSR
jgi:transposase-like protein